MNTDPLVKQGLSRCPRWSGFDGISRFGTVLTHTAPAAFGANEPIWPAPLEQKESATRLIRESTLKYDEESVFPSHGAGLSC